LAEQLDAHRKRQQAQHATLTLTDLYNVVEKLKARAPLTAKDQTVNQQGLASVVLSLHQQLDAAVADAYGWPEGRTPDGLPESEILTRLVRLNHERAAEEQAGTIRYLRPDYQQSDGRTPGAQAPQAVQMGLDLPEPSGQETQNRTSSPSDVLREWPRDLAKQMQAVRDVVQQAGGPVRVTQVAAQFGKLRPATVQPLLDTLSALALLRQTEEGAYVG
jgi:hypothetical protein